MTARRLLPINALLGLCTLHDINPAPLAEVGYRVVALEVPLSTGGNNSVVPDVVLFHDDAAHIVLCEGKSGANVEVDQARRYNAVTPQRVIQATSINLPHAVKPSLEVLYLGLEEHAERLSLSLESAGVEYPLLAVSDKAVRLVDPERASDRLKASLSGRGVELLAPPATYIPYDHESDVSEFLSPVRSQLVRVAALGESSVTVRRLAEDCCKYYAFYGRAARRQLLQKVTTAARRIARDYPDTFQCSLGPGKDDTIVRILRTPEAFDARGRTQAYQALSRRSRPRQRLQPDPNQLDLLHELGDGDDSEDDEAEERP
ncbi:hypothetical protein [Streptomyces longwoodensis]|uniref:hypothetical protein n=1 Tax=Streptomyces longwoodensis TaxID=68231 RepID=UPI00324DDDBC